MLRPTLLSLTLPLLLAGCWNPFTPQCEGAAPTCYRSCSSPREAAGCFGAPYQATCFDEDGDVRWSCNEPSGLPASACPEFVDTCRPAEPIDAGTLPTDAGTLPTDAGANPADAGVLPGPDGG